MQPNSSDDQQVFMSIILSDVMDLCMMCYDKDYEAFDKYLNGVLFKDNPHIDFTSRIAAVLLMLSGIASTYLKTAEFGEGEVSESEHRAFAVQWLESLALSAME